MGSSETVRFRHHQAILVAAIIAFIGAIPLVNGAPYLVPVLLIPVAVAAWAWRAGTDADRDGVRVRALFGSRDVPWSAIAELGADPRGRVLARRHDGTVVPLTAVTRGDLPRLVAASGHDLRVSSRPPPD
ncbi:MAG TPA: PH domain-containing protein [Micromonosporaceae bacterium]|nr:PH domain-containing protein [Micromonosporaceae bacterium]